MNTFPRYLMDKDPVRISSINQNTRVERHLFVEYRSYRGLGKVLLGVGVLGFAVVFIVGVL